jgi:hypothetical protein
VFFPDLRYFSPNLPGKKRWANRSLTANRRSGPKLVQSRDKARAGSNEARVDGGTFAKRRFTVITLKFLMEYALSIQNVVRTDQNRSRIGIQFGL